MTSKKKNIKRKKVEVNMYDDSWMYILLLSTLVILIESLKSYTFQIDRISITYSIFLLPLIYFITNYITKKYNYKKSLLAISISGLAVVLFVILMNFMVGKEFLISNICGQLSGYVISQFINLTIYSFLLDNTNSPFILVFLNYLFSLIVFYVFYTLIYLNMLILDDFWVGYFSVLLIQSIICIGLTIIDKKIKRGVGKEEIIKG